MPRPKFRHFELYDAIKAAGDWITRPELADATGKRVLSPNDKERLKELVAQGYIEESILRVGGHAFVRYRIPEGAPVLEDED